MNDSDIHNDKIIISNLYRKQIYMILQHFDCGFAHAVLRLPREAIAGAVGKAIPVLARPTARPERTREMLQIFQKLQCWTDTMILTTIDICFICVLTNNWRNDISVV